MARGLFRHPPNIAQAIRRPVLTASGPNAVAGSFTANAIIKRTKYADTQASSAIPASPNIIAYGDSASEAAYGQSFTPAASGNLAQVRYALGFTGGTPVDTAVVELWTSSASKPGTFIATIASVAPGSMLEDVLTSFSSVVNIPVVSGTKYWIVFTRSGAVAAESYITTATFTSVYPGGGLSTLVSGVWSAESSTTDAYFLTDVALGFTANAVIKATRSGTFTADAVIKVSAIWTTPANGVSISSTPVLTFLMPPSSRDMHFEIQIDDNSGFTSPDVFKSHSNLTGWEYWNGSAWTAIPQSGVPAAFGGNEARYTVQTPLTGTIYRRVRAGQI